MHETFDYVKQLAKIFRRNMTKTEAILWTYLKEKRIDGYKFRLQYPVYRYILDFFCFEKSLAIEIDGDIHKQRKDYDDYRDEFLQSIDIKTLRFTTDDVENNLDEVIQKIKYHLHQQR